MATIDDVTEGLLILRKHFPEAQVGRRAYEIVVFSNHEDEQPITTPEQLTEAERTTLESLGWHYSTNTVDWYCFY